MTRGGWGKPLPQSENFPEKLQYCAKKIRTKSDDVICELSQRDGEFSREGSVVRSESPFSFVEVMRDKMDHIPGHKADEIDEGTVQMYADFGSVSVSLSLWVGSEAH